MSFQVLIVFESDLERARFNVFTLLKKKGVGYNFTFFLFKLSTILATVTLSKVLSVHLDTLVGWGRE